VASAVTGHPRPAPVSWPLARPKRPVAQVAAQFPQLCETETDAFGWLLGRPVQHPAAISRSEGTGATHVTAPLFGHSRNNH